MAWNEPGGGRNNDPWGDRKDDPWGRGGNDKGPPDMDEAFRSMQEQLARIFGGKSGSGGGASGAGGPSAQLVAVLAGLAVVAYFVAGFYTLDEQERGVIFRFGAVEQQVSLPGLRWAPPAIDEVQPVNVTRVRSAEHQALMLTEDQNIVDVSLTVQYLVTDPVAFVVNVRSPEDSLKQALESALPVKCISDGRRHRRGRPGRGRGDTSPPTERELPFRWSTWIAPPRDPGRFR